MIYAATLTTRGTQPLRIALGKQQDLRAAYFEAKRLSPVGYQVAEITERDERSCSGCGADMPLLIDTNGAGC